MQNYLLIASGGLGVFACIAHAWLGERFILRPLYAEGTSTILKNPRTRDLVRAVWHIPSAAWGILGGLLIYASMTATSAPLLICAAAGVFLVSGLANFAALRRLHIGAVVLALAAALAFAGLWA
ncbi:MAG: hypothetical protein VX640_11780 [Pseudomonadota bacterium]|nr:hypothetical protein [Pseudomonadota bacterium]